jgi:hypothetical protein
VLISHVKLITVTYVSVTTSFQIQILMMEVQRVIETFVISSQLIRISERKDLINPESSFRSRALFLFVSSYKCRSLPHTRSQSVLAPVPVIRCTTRHSVMQQRSACL